LDDAAIVLAKARWRRSAAGSNVAGVAVRAILPAGPMDQDRRPSKPSISTRHVTLRI
jgi:hypothetical protein